MACADSPFEARDRLQSMLYEPDVSPQQGHCTQDVGSRLGQENRVVACPPPLPRAGQHGSPAYGSSRLQSKSTIARVHLMDLTPQSFQKNYCARGVPVVIEGLFEDDMHFWGLRTFPSMLDEGDRCEHSKAAHKVASTRDALPTCNEERLITHHCPCCPSERSILIPPQLAVPHSWCGLIRDDSGALEREVSCAPRGAHECWQVR